MKAEHWQRIHDELISSCLGLFRDNGVAIVPSEERGPGVTQGEAIVSFIGFLGEQIRGHLTILAPVTLITESHPLRRTAEIDEAALCDWSCELANQLLGRTKNRLLELGIVIELSTPSTALGHRLRGHDERREGFRVLHFDCHGDRLTLLFDALAGETPPVTLRAVGSGSRRVEGDILLF